LIFGVSTVPKILNRKAAADGGLTDSGERWISGLEDGRRQGWTFKIFFGNRLTLKTFRFLRHGKLGKKTFKNKRDEWLKVGLRRRGFLFPGQGFPLVEVELHGDVCCGPTVVGCRFKRWGRRREKKIFTSVKGYVRCGVKEPG
jgi:hypothetical protein